MNVMTTAHAEIFHPDLNEVFSSLVDSVSKADYILLGDDNISHQLVIKLSDFNDNLNSIIIEGGQEDRVKLADGAAHWQKDGANLLIDGVNFEKYTAMTSDNQAVNVFISENLGNTVLD